MRYGERLNNRFGGKQEVNLINRHGRTVTGRVEFMKLLVYLYVQTVFVREAEMTDIAFVIRCHQIDDFTNDTRYHLSYSVSRCAHLREAKFSAQANREYRLEKRERTVKREEGMRDGSFGVHRHISA